MACKAIRLNEVTKIIRLDRKKIIRALGHANIKNSERERHSKGQRMIGQ